MAISQRVTARLRSIRTGPWTRGIDEKTEAHGINPEKCRNARNVQMDEKSGAAIKRDGSRVISLLPSGNPARDVGVFARTDGASFLLASDGTDLYFTTDPTEQSLWTLLVAGLDSDAFLEFETAEDKIWGTNGVDRVFSWDGTTLRTYDREFTATIDNASITTTTVAHAGLTDADDFWNGQTIAWTSGANAGVRSTVTDFDAATDTLTFTPALTEAILVTDRFKVGLIIPQGRAIRFWDARLWIASTTVNLSELRFHRLTDPNTGADIPIDDPIAWPPTFQLDINSADGDRIWGITPVLRDRFLIHKSTGFFRIERDPLTIYTFEVVARAIGSRFQRSFAEKKGLLYFYGQDKDGLPDLYLTDMVSIRPVDPDGGLEPTLRALRQPNAIQKSQLFSSQPDFNAGTKSTLLDTSQQGITIGAVDTKAEWDVFVSVVNVVTDATADAIEASSPGLLDDFESGLGNWTVVGSYSADSKFGSIRATNRDFTTLDLTGSMTRVQNNAFGVWKFNLSQRLDGTNITYLDYKFIRDGGNFYSVIVIGPNGSTLRLTKNGAVIASASISIGFNTPTDFEIRRDSAGEFKIFVGASLKITFTDNTFQTSVDCTFSLPGTNVGDQGVAWMDNVQLPRQITSGEYIKQFDFTRIPDSLRRVFVDANLFNGSFTLESFTSDSSDFTTGNDPAGFTSFANGAVPTSQIKEHMRIKISISGGAVITSLKGGALWLSPAVFIGSNIASWRNFLATLTQPAGTDLEIKIRSTTVLTTPAEIDFSAFFTIVPGDNIGTILSDGSPPSTRQIQLKVELGPESSGAIPIAESLLVQWNEGSADILPLHGVVHKKRYLAAAAQDTSATNNIVIVNDRNEGWMKYFGWDVNAMIHFRGILIGFSSTDDAILELDSAGLKSDRGAAIQAFVETREELGSREDLRKDWRYGVLHVGTIASTITVSLKRVSDSGFVEAVTKTLEGRALDKRINFRPGTVTKRLQRRYENNVLNEGMEINGETLYYSLRSQLPNGG